MATSYTYILRVLATVFSKVRYIEGICDEGTRNLVRNNVILRVRYTGSIYSSIYLSESKGPEF